MKKYLTDKEILRWNDRIGDKIKIIIKPIYDNQGDINILIDPNYTAYGSLSINGYKQAPVIVPPSGISDPLIQYHFSFSVAYNRKDDFFDIYKKLKTEPICNKVIHRTSKGDVEKKVDIIITDDVIKSSNTTEHNILDKKYIRYSYELEGGLSSIMAFVMYFEDAIEFLQKLYGYDESGKEYLLVKYPIGSIISLVKDKSEDYLVFDYSYEKSPTAEYSIYYIICKMSVNGPIIKYEEPFRTFEDNLCFSRNGRIDDILN